MAFAKPASGLKTIKVSGAVGLVGLAEDLGAGAATVLADLTATLGKAGATLADVVKMNVYIVDISPEKVGSVGTAVHEAFKHLPKEERAASTWVGVTGLVDPSLGVEIECEAVISEAAVTKSYIEPQKAGFSGAVAYSEAGSGLTTVTVSGAVGTAADLSAGAATALDGLGATLGKAGATFADVVKMNVYIVDIDGEKVGAVGGAVGAAFAHLPADKRSASTWVGVTGLVDPSLGVEIECEAVIPSTEPRL